MFPVFVKQRFVEAVHRQESCLLFKEAFKLLTQRIQSLSRAIRRINIGNGEQVRVFLFFFGMLIEEAGRAAGKRGPDGAARSPMSPGISVKVTAALPDRAQVSLTALGARLRFVARAKTNKGNKKINDV